MVSNIISKYLGKDFGKAAEQLAAIGTGVGGGVIINQGVTQITKKPGLGKIAGLVAAAATKSPIPPLLYTFLYAPDLLNEIRNMVTGIGGKK
jgi:hypothetical protein